jgi:hypothetical protein
MKKQSAPAALDAPMKESQPDGLLIKVPDVAGMDVVPNVTAMVEDFAPPEYFKCQKTGIVTRVPTIEEKARLMNAAKQQGIEVHCDLQKGPAWVAEAEGEIIGCLRARLIFEVQPFPVQGGALTPEMNERAAQLMLEACHRWMRSFRNGLGVEESFQLAVTPDRQNLLKRLGWKVFNVAEATLFGKTFGGKYIGNTRGFGAIC